MTLIKEMLEKTETIAVIGAKDDETSPAYKVPLYLSLHGYRIFAVNPKLAGKELFGQITAEKVTRLIDPVDMVNIFRRPEYLVGHAVEILEMSPQPKYVWFQLGIYNDEAARMLEEKGIKVIQNRCIMVEHANIY
jgi:predicted CoA-binding protein